MARVDSIRGGIAPSPHAGVGENVIRAIASYAGQAIRLKRNGATVQAYPFTEQMRYTVAPPGRLPLRSTLFSLVEVPDLHVLAALWPQAQSIWMGAGPVPEMLHRALMACAWLVRGRFVRSLSPLAPLMYWATNRLRWGEHRGGMFVEVVGADHAGATIKRSWHLLAEGDDGPFIPSMAVEALLRRALEGILPPAGARAAVREVEVGDYEKLFAGRNIQTGIRDDTADAAMPLYRRVLGDAWNTLPAEIAAMHNLGSTAVAEGRASVERGKNPLARLAGLMVGFPPAAADTAVQVKFEATKSGETWTRTFGDRNFSSRQYAGQGRSDRLLWEQFGLLKFAMAVVCEGDKLRLVLRRWSVFGIPLPMWLCPHANSYETSEGGQFHFHVEISHPLTGLIVRYRGWLAPTAGSRAR
jgi:hypothetical protein